MRIGIQTWGSHGDIRPFIALARGLATAGHDVSLIATIVDETDYRTTLANESFQYTQVASPVVPDKKAYTAITQSIINNKKPLDQIKLILHKLLTPAEDEMYMAAEELCLNNDIVIGHYFHYPIHTAAEKTGTPYISVMLVHSLIPSLYQPPVTLPSMGKWTNQLFWWIFQSLIHQQLKPVVNEFRIKKGLKPINNLVAELWSSKLLNLIAVSPKLCQRAKDWTDNHQICGFLNTRNIAVEGTIPSTLAQFLKNGSAPIYLNFGSMIPPTLEAQKNTADLFINAVNQAGCRAIIQIPLWQQCSVTSSNNIHFVQSAPHRLVFPHCLAVVHHGGAGTTQTATLAGIPSIVIVHISEQNIWGTTLYKLGIATRPILRRNLTANNLARQIMKVMNSTSIQKKAKAIGKSMENEDGVTHAIALIEQSVRFHAQR